MIHVRVAHEDVAHLVGDLRREPPAVPEIEQQAAPALPQADMQQRITEQAVDQQCAGDAEVNEAGRVGVFALRCPKVGGARQQASGRVQPPWRSRAGPPVRVLRLVRAGR